MEKADMEGGQKSQLNYWTPKLTPEECSAVSQKCLQLEKECENFDVLDTDIWICGYPRSGTTWLSEMVWLIANNCDFERAKIKLHERCPILEASIYANVFGCGMEMPSLSFITDSINHTKNLPNPRCIKCHLPFEMWPKQIRSGVRKPKVIYVIRNPLDVCLSYFYYLHLLLPEVTLEEHCKMFLEGKLRVGNYAQHVISFWKRKNNPNYMILFYKDMKQDLTKTIRQVADFLKVTIQEEQFQKLMNHLSFQSIKTNPAVHSDPVLYFHPKTEFFRSGVVGGYQKEMSAEIVEYFEKWIQDSFEGTGLSFQK